MLISQRRARVTIGRLLQAFDDMPLGPVQYDNDYSLPPPPLPAGESQSLESGGGVVGAPASISDQAARETRDSDAFAEQSTRISTAVAPPIERSMRRFSGSSAAILPRDFARRVSELLQVPQGGEQSDADRAGSTSTLLTATASAAVASGASGDFQSFVVDQQSLVLRPGVRERVRLRLCATACGTLRIIGARWRLFGEVHHAVRSIQKIGK